MSLTEQVCRNRVAATELARTIARQHGYGHVIASLRQEWAEVLMQRHGLSAEDAMRATNVDAYPLGSSVFGGDTPRFKCPVCGEPQYDAPPHGMTCPNGHGGEEGIPL